MQETRDEPTRFWVASQDARSDDPGKREAAYAALMDLGFNAGCARVRTRAKAVLAGRGAHLVTDFAEADATVR